MCILCFTSLLLLLHFLSLNASSCSFGQLQGPQTDPDAIAVIRKGIADGRDTSVTLINYKKDGTPFWNRFFVAPLRGVDGAIVNFVGVQCEVKDSVARVLVASQLAMYPKLLGIPPQPPPPPPPGASGGAPAGPAVAAPSTYPPLQPAGGVSSSSIASSAAAHNVATHPPR